MIINILQLLAFGVIVYYAWSIGVILAKSGNGFLNLNLAKNSHLQRRVKQLLLRLIVAFASFLLLNWLSLNYTF